jgi:hypothetical protein
MVVNDTTKLFQSFGSPLSKIFGEIILALNFDLLFLICG